MLENIEDVDMSAWIDQIFEAEQAANGNVVRRSVDDVSKYASEEELIEEVKKRGYHLVKCADQFLIICNGGNIKIII